MSLFAALAETPDRLSPEARFTIWCGVFYAANGLLLLAWPGAIQTLFRETAFEGREEALVRLIGMLLAIVGWFYFFGGRTGGRQFVASTVLDRLVLVPLVLIPTALAGVFPALMLTFAVVDPALALVAWWLLARDQFQDVK